MQCIKKNKYIFGFAFLYAFLGCIFNNIPLRNGMIIDPFHQGEYFATLNSNNSVLTIHGALDYIPAMLCRWVFGSDVYFFPTMMTYAILNFLSCAILLLIVFILCKENKNSVSLLLFACAAPFLVGYRDLFLLFAVYLYFFIQQKHDRTPYKFILEGLLGAAMAAGVFWSFDRGLVAVLAIGSGGFIHACKTKSYIFSAVVFFVIMLLSHKFLPAFNFYNYCENVIFLMNSASQWQYGWKRHAIVITGVLGLVQALTLYLLVATFVDRRRDYSCAANAVFFMVLSCMMCKVAINRADLFHLVMALWAPALAVFFWLSRRGEFKPNRFFRVFLIGCIGCFLALAYKQKSGACLLIALLMIAVCLYDGLDKRVMKKRYEIMFILGMISLLGGAVWKNVRRGDYNWVGYFFKLPTNVVLSGNAMHWVSNALIDAKAECVFDFVNNGVINGLTELPGCTRFAYLVYASPANEAEMITDLKSRHPPAIVYSTLFWSFYIDGRTMSGRFPNLDAFILQTYTVEKCSFDYCVRYLGEEPHD